MKDGHHRLVLLEGIFRDGLVVYMVTKEAIQLTLIRKLGELHSTEWTKLEPWYWDAHKKTLHPGNILPNISSVNMLNLAAR